MAYATSASAHPRSRDQILNLFQEMTNCNFDDSLFFLDQYNWKIENVIDDMSKGKNFTPRSNESRVAQRSNPRPQPTVNNDQELARLISIYGDQDEQARRHRQQDFHQHTSDVETPTNSKIYHEKQEYLRCGLHALNNLFQTPRLFTKERLESIMQQYDRRNSSNEYGELFIGDYDLRVLVSAIENHGYFVRQVNVNRDRTLKSYPWDSFFGLLINQNGEHWFAIKSFEGIYHNLDSTFSRPVAIGDMARLIYHLNFLIDCGYQIYIFAVTKTKTQF